MTRPELDRLLVRRFRAILAPRGYTRRHFDWYRRLSGWTISVFVRQWHPRLIVKFARFDHRLVRNTHPYEIDASEVVGKSALVPDFNERYQARTYSLWRDEADAAAFFVQVEKYGLPLLESWEENNRNPGRV